MTGTASAATTTGIPAGRRWTVPLSSRSVTANRMGG